MSLSYQNIFCHSERSCCQISKNVCCHLKTRLLCLGMINPAKRFRNQSHKKGSIQVSWLHKIRVSELWSCGMFGRELEEASVDMLLIDWKLNGFVAHKRERERIKGEADNSSPPLSRPSNSQFPSLKILGSAFLNYIKLLNCRIWRLWNRWSFRSGCTAAAFWTGKNTSNILLPAVDGQTDRQADKTDGHTDRLTHGQTYIWRIRQIACQGLLTFRRHAFFYLSSFPRIGDPTERNFRASKYVDRRFSTRGGFHGATIVKCSVRVIVCGKYI